MYAGPLKATVCIQVGSSLIRMDKSFGDLPLMVGSSRCRLAGKTPAELVAMKEEATECGGYFIVNGIERIIRLLQVRIKFRSTTCAPYQAAPKLDSRACRPWFGLLSGDPP